MPWWTPSSLPPTGSRDLQWGDIAACGSCPDLEGGYICSQILGVMPDTHNPQAPGHLRTHSLLQCAGLQVTTGGFFFFCTSNILKVALHINVQQLLFSISLPLCICMPTSLEFLSYLLPFFFFFLCQEHSYFRKNWVTLPITEVAKHSPWYMPFFSYL